MGADLACVWRVLNESSRTFVELGLQTAAGNCTRAADVVSNAQAALERAEAVAQAAVAYAAEVRKGEARGSMDPEQLTPRHDALMYAVDAYKKGMGNEVR